MSKRGFIRTLEAVLAVLIVLIFIFTVNQTNSGSSQIESIRELEEGILRGIVQDESMRNCIVSTVQSDDDGNGVGDLDEISTGIKCSEVRQFVVNSLPNRFRESFELQACESGSCVIPNLPDKNVFTAGAVVSSSLTDEKYAPRLVRIWIWA